MRQYNTGEGVSSSSDMSLKPESTNESAGNVSTNQSQTGKLILLKSLFLIIIMMIGSLIMSTSKLKSYKNLQKVLFEMWINF